MHRSNNLSFYWMTSQFPCHFQKNYTPNYLVLVPAKHRHPLKTPQAGYQAGSSCARTAERRLRRRITKRAADWVIGNSTAMIGLEVTLITSIMSVARRTVKWPVWRRLHSAEWC